MKIREVFRQPKCRVRLVGEDGTDLILDKRTWEESPFGVGSSLSDADIEELTALSLRNRAREKAVFLLSRRDYSHRELAQKLCREAGRYYADRQEAAEEAAVYMEERGYVDDTRYAARLAQMYLTERAYPCRRAVQKLCEKGVARAVAEEVVSAIGFTDRQLALEFLQKKRYNVPESSQQAEKLYAAMARYGFSGEDIRHALSVWQEAEDN